jgi:hypothetical protein
MQKRRRIVKIIGYTAGVLLIVLVCLLLFPSKFINNEWVKKELLQVLSRNISGTVEFRSVAISFFPVPRLSIDQARIAVPGKLDATIANLDLFPELIPLLRGEAKISRLQVREPVVALPVPDKREKEALSAEQVSASLKSLVSETAGLTFSIENGSISIIHEGHAPATLQRIDARAVVESKQGGVTVTLDHLQIASPRLTLSGTLGIRPSSPRIRLDLRGEGLSVRQAGDFLLSAAGEMPPVGRILDILRDGTISEITFHSQGDSFEDLGGSLNTEIKGELVQGSIHVPGPGLDFTAVNGAFAVSQGVLQAADVTGRSGKSSLGQTSLRLDVKGDGGPLHLETLFRADLGEVLTLLRRLVADKDFLQELTLIQSLNGTAVGRLLVGGTLASLEPRVAVSEMNLSARHRHVPFPITVRGGAFTYAKDQISVQDLEGTVGQTAFSGISVRLDQRPEPQLAVRTGLLRIHAAEMYGWLSSFERTRAFSQDIAATDGSIAVSSFSISGPALSPGSWTVNAAGSSEGLTVTSPHLPAPLRLACRSFSYEQNGISVEELSATMGNSNARGIGARLDTGASPQIEIRSAQATVDAGEIHRWLASQEKMKDALQEISSVSGTITLTTLGLKGPLSAPKEWQFKTTGAADSLVIGAPSLPDRLVLRKGSFFLSPEAVILDTAHVSMLDTEATLSGTLTVSPEASQQADVLIDADIGPKGMQWIKAVASMPEILKIPQRLSLARGHIVTFGKGGASFQGEIATQGGQTLSLSLAKEQTGLKIDRLEIADGASRASITLDSRERSWDMTFSGRLDSSTVAALIELEQMPAGYLAGDFSAHILRNQPWESRASGRLSGERIVLPWKPGIPLQIDAISLSAEGGRVSVQSSLLHLEDMALFASGALAFGKDGLDMDMEIEAERVEWASLERIMGKGMASAPAASPGAPSLMPVRGKAEIKVQTFIYDKYTVSPLHADILFSPGQATAHIRKAALCNITAQGPVGLAGADRNMEITLSAKDQDMGPAIACLSDRGPDVTGRFSLDASLSMSLQTNLSLKGLEGAVSFRAREGRINHSVPLSGLFSLLSATEYFRGLPDLRNEGLTYSTVAIAGDIHQGTLSLKEAFIDGPTILLLAEGSANLADRKLDVTVLAAPFKTLDSMLKILPKGKDDRIASLVSVGVGVTGDIHNPVFSIQPLSGISRGLTGVMERVLKAPVRIIESFSPGTKNQRSGQ